MNADLLRRAQRGVPEARAALVRDVGPLLASVVRRLGARDDAEDQVQAIFAHVFAVLSQFDPAGPAQFTTWVYTVAHRWLLMQHRRARPEVVELERAFELVDPGPSPEDTAAARQLSERLERAIRALPDPYRRVFVLAQLHQQPHDAIAAVEGIPVGTVKSRLHRARAELVVHLGDALDDVPLKRRQT